MKLLSKLRRWHTPVLLLPSDLPFWEHRAPPRGSTKGRLRVLWTGSQVAPVPILTRDPPDFDPTR